MTRKFHKAQSEALIKQFNGSRSHGVNPRDITYLLDLAQVHATLATVPDEEEE